MRSVSAACLTSLCGSHHDHEVEDPICSGGDGVGRSTNIKRCDLCWVEPVARHNYAFFPVLLERHLPSHSKPSDREEAVESEEEDRRSDA